MLPDSERRLQVAFDAHQYDLAEAEKDALLADLDGLAKQVAHFPTHDLRVLIEGNSRSNDVSVKLSLILDGATLVASDHDRVVPPAFERCLLSLTHQLKGYKDRLGLVAERRHLADGTAHPIEPSHDPDPRAVEAAVDAGDFAAYRAALLPYEESVRKRVGRWVERYPDVDAMIGRKFTLADVVDEVFLYAFDGHPRRPADIRYGDFLEAQIDPAVRALAAHPDDELDNINAVRAAADVGGPAVE